MIVESDVKEFVGRLPELCPETVHLCMMAARSRITKHILNTHAKDIVVERDVIRNRENWRVGYVDKIFNLSLLQESGKYSFDRESNRNITIPNVSLGLFSTVNPRSSIVATKELVSDAIKRRFEDPNDIRTFDRIDVEFFGRLHASRWNKSQAKYITLDVDDAEIYKEIYDLVSPFEKLMITKTARGYHIVLNLSGKDIGREFYQPGHGVWPKIHETYNNGGCRVELQRDSQEPIPGTKYAVCIPGQPINTENYVKIIE